MHKFATDIVPITAARARLTEIAAEVVASGQPKVLTRNGESYVAVVGVADLDEFRRLRAADHERNLHDLVRAAREAAAGKAMAVADFRKQAAALISSVVADASPGRVGKSVGRRKRR
jgi:prevent-host-death family protein